MSARPFYGWDRHMKAIYHGSIIRFREVRGGQLRIGHIWRSEDWQNEEEFVWHVSFNHCYSETGYCLRDNPICSIGVLGDAERDPSDEELMNLDGHCPNPPEVGWLPPHWKREDTEDEIYWAMRKRYDECR
jgi:hypothetical protein